MKDIKSYVIGFLTCACLFLVMGQTKQEADANMDANMEQVIKMANKMKDSGFMPEPVGRYQYMSDHTEDSPYGGRNWEIWILDTNTGNIISATKTNRHQDTPLRESIKFTQIIADAEAHRWNANK